MSLVAYGISDDSGSEDGTETEETDKLIDIESVESGVEVEQTNNGDTLDSSVSSDKEDEDDDEDAAEVADATVLDKGERTMRLPKPKNGPNGTADPLEENVPVSGSGLFSSLPAPRGTSKVSLEVEMDDQLISRSQLLGRKETVKITVPSLSEFKDDETLEPERKKPKPSLKGSGLFALLPAPKNMTVKEAKRSLVPNVLTKKPTAFTVNPAPSVARQADRSKPKQSQSLTLTSYEDSGDEMEDGDEGDFFSLSSGGVTVDSVGAVPDLTADADDDDDSSQVNMAGGEDSVQSGVLEAVSSELESECSTSSLHEPADGETSSLDQDDQDLLLNKEAMQRLCGRRAVRDQAAMQFIDVSGDTLMPDPKEWLTKQLTQEQRQKSYSHRKNEGPTTQQKRKHQITYLAFQAKENELELKNQWSQNRISRKQTQSKYGF